MHRKRHLRKQRHSRKHRHSRKQMGGGWITNSPVKEFINVATAEQIDELFEVFKKESEKIFYRTVVIDNKEEEYYYPIDNPKDKLQHAELAYSLYRFQDRSCGDKKNDETNKCKKGAMLNYYDEIKNRLRFFDENGKKRIEQFKNTVKAKITEMQRKQVGPIPSKPGILTLRRVIPKDKNSIA